MVKRATIARSMTSAAATPAVAGDAALAAVRDGTNGDDMLVATHHSGQDNGGR